jgi:glyoxylase-like metal-dependent hydrolase (beta-lactamase superfamily II)
MALRIDHLVTSGKFTLDGGSWDVDNNVWMIGDDDEVLIFDAPHDAAAIEAAAAGRRVVAIACTHAHDDHVDAAPELARRVGAKVLLHPSDHVLWKLAHPDAEPDGELVDGQRIEVGGSYLEVLHTPGHAPGGICFLAPESGVVFTGDTLFAGGPGATGRSYSSFPLILESITKRLLTLPPETLVHTGHGDSTTIGAEAPHLQEWIDRGH